MSSPSHMRLIVTEKQEEVPKAGKAERKPKLKLTTRRAGAIRTARRSQKKPAAVAAKK